MTRTSRKVLIKAVIQVIPTYNMSCFKLPKTWYDKLNALIARYWWKKGGRGGGEEDPLEELDQTLLFKRKKRGPWF